MRNFDSILNEKLKGAQAPQYSERPPQPEASNPLSQQWTYGFEIQKLLSSLSHSKSWGAYVKKAAPKINKENFYLSHTELDAKEKIAFHAFAFFGEKLPDFFSEQDLKKAWRKLALKIHPDRNPNKEAGQHHFQTIKEASDLLKKRFVNGRVCRSKSEQNNKQ